MQVFLRGYLVHFIGNLFFITSSYKWSTNLPLCLNLIFWLQRLKVRLKSPGFQQQTPVSPICGWVALKVSGQIRIDTGNLILMLLWFVNLLNHTDPLNSGVIKYTEFISQFFISLSFKCLKRLLFLFWLKVVLEMKFCRFLMFWCLTLNLTNWRNLMTIE